MNRSQQSNAGIALFAAGIVVAVLGYLGVSKETDVAFQLPYFASAGIGALLLFAGGATLIGRAQLTADATRLKDVEDAVRMLADEVRRLTDDVSTSRVRAVGDLAVESDAPAPHKPRARSRAAARR